MENKSETPANAESVGKPTSEAQLAATHGYAAGPKWWEVWPLLMALGFICMAKNNSMAELVMRAITVAAITYSLSLKLCRRRHSAEVSHE